MQVGTFEVGEREKTEIFQDLPLKDEDSLEVMETKLKNDLSYRNEMVSQKSIFKYYKIFEKKDNSLGSDKYIIQYQFWKEL